MKPSAWKWLEDGGVEVAGVVYKPTEGLKEATVSAFRHDYASKTMVFTVLYRAKLAYETGAADYAGARQRLPELLREYGLAERDLEESATSIDKFFAPAGIHVALVEDAESFGRFLDEATERLVGKR